MEIDHNYYCSHIFIKSRPISDDMVSRLVDMDFWKFTRAVVFVENGLKTDINKFIEEYLEPKQKEIVYDYIRDNIEKITEQFFGNRSVKSANK